MSESRVLRDRLIEFQAALDNAGLSRAQRQSAFIGQVYNAGSMPTGAMKYYAVHPVTLSGAETEGAGGGLTPLAASIMVLLLRGPDPVVGTVLVCYQVGDRWVAERSNPSDSGTATEDCPCPRGPMTIHATFPSGCELTYLAGRTIDLTYGPNPHPSDWAYPTNIYTSTASVIVSGDTWLVLWCSGVGADATHHYVLDVVTPSGGGPGMYTQQTVASYDIPATGNTCVPFLLSNCASIFFLYPHCCSTISG